jgi:uncharacterized membrane protein
MMTPISAAIERFIIATILLFLIFGPRGKLRGEILKRNLWVYVALGLLGVTCFNMATFFGLQTTTTINGVLILATTPLWTTILASLLEGERIDLMRGFGILCGLLSVGLVITRGDLEILRAHKFVLGDAIILVGSIAWALNTVISRRFVALANHYLFEPVACTPASGWEKGQVENQVGNIRERLFTPLARFASFAALNDWLATRCKELAQRKHPVEPSRTIAECFAQEGASLRVIAAPFDGYVEQMLRASSFWCG